MSSRKSDRRSKVGAGGEPKTPGRAAGGSGGGQFEWGGKHYTAMTELLRAIQKDSPGQPEDYYQGIFENKFKLTAVQVSYVLLLSLNYYASTHVLRILDWKYLPLTPNMFVFLGPRCSG